MKKIYLITVVFFLSLNVLFAQDHIVHGIIHTLDSIPLEGVDIKIKSTKEIVKTDSLGKFVAVCNLEDKLTVKAIGFYGAKIKVDEKTKLVAINMKLKPGEKQREYAIGYGYVNEKDLTSAMNVLNEKEMNFSRYNNIFDLIGSMGAEVRNGEIIIRGNKSFQGSSAALIVVDGAVMDADNLNTLKPIDVAKIDILRDGTASIYGTRGANGVVLIETKKGN
jgi:TonB-dependent SusC/RagA subfamily outer membrane receptor